MIVCIHTDLEIQSDIELCIFFFFFSRVFRVSDTGLFFLVATRYSRNLVYFDGVEISEECNKGVFRHGILVFFIFHVCLVGS